MSAFGSTLVHGARLPCVLFAAFALRASRAEVISLTIGIDSRCPSSWSDPIAVMIPRQVHR